MNLLSDYKEDVSKVKTKPGGYEWWYFDATDDNEVYQFVIIFYRGNPFSPRYHRKLAGEKPAREARPQQYPAISIAIYKEYQPIYYSFTEFEEEDCRFGDSPLQVQVGEHRLRGEVRDGQLCYTLNLKERLPCGDRMVAIIEYRSPLPSQAAFDFSEGDASAGHIWNLVQPRAEVRGSIRLFTLANPPEAIHFSGTGYHDHNTGEEPMSDEFREWYWGRFHFDSATLVYY
ncbi:MAG: hypothetical protein R3211_00550, partial [Balneolaceae bacterium]|nr:hypothetical protein [Balneolaceae bacterium]